MTARSRSQKETGPYSPKQLLVGRGGKVAGFLAKRCGGPLAAQHRLELTEGTSL